MIQTKLSPSGDSPRGWHPLADESATILFNNPMHNHNILRALNVLSILIQTSYELGYEFGKFYRQHLHHHVVSAVALLITVCVHLWVNRHRYRNTVEALFVYRYEPMVNLAPIVHPLYASMESLMDNTSKQLRSITGVKRKVSKVRMVGQYLSMV